MPDYEAMLALLKGSNETFEQIQGALTKLAEPTPPPAVDPSTIAGAGDGIVAAWNAFQSRQIMQAQLKYEVQQVLRTKSTPELHMLFGLQLAKRGQGIPFEMWAAGGGQQNAVFDAFRMQAGSGMAADITPEVQRALDTGGAAALIRQDLEPFLYELYVRDFTAYDRFVKEPANGLVHTWNQITSFGAAKFMPELGTVTDDTNVYARKTTNIAIAATRRGLSLKSQYAVTAGGMSYNPMDLELQGGLRAIAALMQYQIFSGASSDSGGLDTNEIGLYDANGFDGLRGALNTVRAQNVNPLTGTAEDIKHAIDLTIAQMTQAGGVNPSIMWAHPLDKITFDQQQDEKTRIIVPNQVNIGVGATAQEVNVLSGTVPFGIVRGNSITTYTADHGGSHVWRDLYILDESTVSLPYLGSEGPTVLDIPIGISGQLTHLFIIFLMHGLAVKALPFSNKLRVRQS